MGVLFENCTGTGFGGIDTFKGIYLESCRDVKFKGLSISNHLNGAGFGSNVKNVSYEKCNFFNNYKTGAYFDYEGSLIPEDIYFSECHSYLNGVGGSFRSGIYVNRAKRVKLLNCLYGDRNKELYQIYGARINSFALDVTIENNHVYSVIAGGVGYSLGSEDSVNILSAFRNNSASAGVTLVAGMNVIPLFSNPKGSKTCVGVLPSYGTRVVGDRIINIAAKVGTPKSWTFADDRIWVSEGNL